jgi:MFS family permease
MQGIRALSEIALVVLVVTGGRLGDVHGSNIIFLVGLIGFIVASLWCGFARSRPKRAGPLVNTPPPR